MATRKRAIMPEYPPGILEYIALLAGLIAPAAIGVTATHIPPVVEFGGLLTGPGVFFIGAVAGTMLSGLLFVLVSRTRGSDAP